MRNAMYILGADLSEPVTYVRVYLMFPIFSIRTSCRAEGVKVPEEAKMGFHH